MEVLDQVAEGALGMPEGARSRKIPPDGARVLSTPAGTSIMVARREVGQGDFAISKDPDMQMTATLGSCVAVVLHDVFGRIGGMTHIFQCVEPGLAGGGAVIAEIEKLVNALMHEGSPRSALEASVIGGARTLGRGRDVGGEIGLVCLKFLDAERILLKTEDLGGSRPRRITLRPQSGSLQIAYPGHDLPPQRIPPTRPRGGELEWF